MAGFSQSFCSLYAIVTLLKYPVIFPCLFSFTVLEDLFSVKLIFGVQVYHTA